MSDIQTAMARAFFACAWADQVENATEDSDAPSLRGCEIMDAMPGEIDPAALDAAESLAARLCGANEVPSLAALLARAVEVFEANPPRYYDRDLTEDLFGHYLAMQAMGSGVGLESFGDCVRDAVKVPYPEFSGFDLSREYFPQRNED